MKILMLSDRLTIGGAETHIFELAHALRAAGHTVIAASAAGAFFERLRDAGFFCVSLPLDSRRPKDILRAGRGLFRLLTQEKFDVIHANARLPAALVAPLCRHLHIPLVVTAHWVFRADGWRRRLSAWGDCTLAVSPDIARYLQANYALPPDRIYPIHNGIDAARYTAADHQTGYGRILHISRLDTDRAAAAGALLRLAPRLLAGGMTSLTIVGEGDCLAAFRAQAAEQNRRAGKEYIHLAGGVTDVLPYLQKGDIFVGVSRAALEAMACGIPVVLAGNEGFLGPLTEENAALAMDGNFCCRAAPPLTDERLFAAVSDLLHNPHAQGVCGALGSSLVQRYYNREQMGKEALTAYRAAIRKTAVPSNMIICGYYGFRNTGDEAILSATLPAVRVAGYHRITLLSRAGESREENDMKGAPSLFCTASPQKALPHCRRGEQSVFLLGGGNLLQDETSRRSLLYYTHLLRLAARRGYAVYVFGGIGRLDAWGESVTRRALAKARGCFARTPADLSHFRRLCPPTCRISLLPDAALWTRPLPAPVPMPQDAFILLSLRGTPSPAFRSALLRFCRTAEANGYRIAAAAMHPTADRDGVHALSASLPRLLCLPPLRGGEMVGVLSRCRLLLSTRLHPLIFAAVAGTPAITWEDGGKIHRFATYAATCAPEGCTPLVLLPREGDELLWQRALSLLRTPLSPGERAAYLRTLRGGQEAFAFPSMP